MAMHSKGRNVRQTWQEVYKRSETCLNAVVAKMKLKVSSKGTLGQCPEQKWRMMRHSASIAVKFHADRLERGNGTTD